MRLRDIGVEEGDDYIQAREHLGDKTIANHLTLLKTMLNVATTLRHTFAAQWVLRGGDIFKLQRILGHQSIQMTMRYAHLAPEAFAADFDRFGTEAPVGPPAVVIELPQAAQ